MLTFGFTLMIIGLTGFVVMGRLMPQEPVLNLQLNFRAITADVEQCLYWVGRKVGEPLTLDWSMVTQVSEESSGRVYSFPILLATEPSQEEVKYLSQMVNLGLQRLTPEQIQAWANMPFEYRYQLRGVKRLNSLYYLDLQVLFKKHESIS